MTVPLLSGASREVTAQACVNLAQWLAACVEIDLGQFRAELSGALGRLAEAAAEGLMPLPVTHRHRVTRGRARAPFF